jgi:hypothetical protein
MSRLRFTAPDARFDGRDAWELRQCCAWWTGSSLWTAGASDFRAPPAEPHELVLFSRLWMAVDKWISPGITQCAYSRAPRASVAWYPASELIDDLLNLERAMAEESTRRLLKVFGIAVTDLEEALAAGQIDGARKAAAELRERMREIIELVERLSDKVAKV